MQCVYVNYYVIMISMQCVYVNYYVIMISMQCVGKKIKCFLSKSTSLPEAWNIQGGGISLQSSCNKYKFYTYIQLHSYDEGRYKLAQLKPNIFMYMYQFRKVCGHVNVCSGDRFCLFLRIFCQILKLFRQCCISELFRHCGISELFRHCGIFLNFHFITLKKIVILKVDLQNPKCSLLKIPSCVTRHL